MVVERKTICFVLSSPFTLNVFLINHLNSLIKYFNIVICININSYNLDKKIDKNIKIINFNINRKISIFKDIFSLFELYKIFKIQKIDSVHCITPKAVLLGCLVSFYMGVPIRIISFSGQVWTTKTGIRRFLLKWIDRLAIKLATNYISDSQSQVEFLRSEGVLKNEKINIFGHGSIAGVDLARFRPDSDVRNRTRSSFSASDDDFIFLFMGRITGEKGIFDIMQAFGGVRLNYPKAKLWMVGPDEEGILEKFVKRNTKLPEGTYWLGPTDTPEIFMMASDVLVLPSYRESFGVVIIEAAACAVPSIAYNIVGVRDAIVDDLTGILVDLHDIEQLKHSILSLMINTDKREMMQKSALERARQFFDATEITEHWVKYYKTRLA
jgi:glycosyltransferase involved in cell wall biosynthesis